MKRDGLTTDEMNILKEIGEWAALGFYEAVNEPWPRAYGRAYRRLYENMGVVIPENRLLIPCEPSPNAWSREDHDLWTPMGFIVDHNHNVGLSWNPKWAEHKKQRFPQHAKFIAWMVQDLDRRLFQLAPGGHFGGYTHNNPDIRRVVNEGFLAMEAELDEQLRHVESSADQADTESKQLLLTLKDYAAGVNAYHARVGQALSATGAQASGERRKELAPIADAWRRCFLHPAGTFLEGLLAVNLTWMLDGCDSIGRVDQVLGPLFERDLAEGRLDITVVRRMLDEWFYYFERFNGWNMQIGGYTPGGRDGCNALTREILTACERNHYRRPNVALRLTAQSPSEILTSALKALANGSGRPALYNDDLYVETLSKMDLGLTPEDAREVGFGGCTETMIAGMSNVGSLEGEINLAKVLELTLHDGFDPVSKQQVAPHSGRVEDLATWDDFMAAFKRQVVYATDAYVANNRDQLTQRFHRGDPKLARTLFTRDCVQRRKSFEAGGARYNWAVVSYQGIAHVIDSLAAIQSCVYAQKKIGWTELLAALAADFKGHIRIHKMLAAVPKFGNDVTEVDDLGRDILRFVWQQLYSHSTPRGGRYLASCILFVTYGNAGTYVGALPDGRHAFVPLSDSIGAAAGRDTRGPTALLNSVAKLPLWLAVGTPVLNIRLSKKLMTTQTGLSQVAALVRGFFAKGGLQIQISVISRAEMLAAKKDPQNHKNLIVRIGGYSEYFVNLDGALQDSVIARTEHVV